MDGQRMVRTSEERLDENESCSWTRMSLSSLHLLLSQ